MSIFNENEEAPAFVFGLMIGIFLSTVLTVFVVCKDEPTRQPIVECTDGKLYDIFYEGNITIIKERPFTTCEERR